MRNGKSQQPMLLAALFAMLCFGACATGGYKQGLPTEVDATVSAIGEDIAAGRYEKIYNEAADQWRSDATLEQSIVTFTTLKNKLGSVQSRKLHSATDENNAGGRLPGHTFVVAYQTKFDRGEGMETLTLVERNGHWLLARYFVNSTALR